MCGGNGAIPDISLSILVRPDVGIMELGYFLLVHCYPLEAEIQMFLALHVVLIQVVSN